MDNDRLMKNNNSYRKIKHIIQGYCVLCLMIILAALNLYAEDIEVRLKSDDPNTKFAIQDSNTSNVATIDPDGNIVVESSATIKGTLKASKYLSESQDAGVTLTADDFGKTITVNSASAQTVSLPSVDSQDIGVWFKVVKLGNGKVTIDAADSDTIADSGAGETIYCSTPSYASVTIQLANASEWVITDGSGQWMTVSGSADNTLFNFSYWLKYLPDTSQTVSYTATFGEDNDYEPAATQPSYTDNGDETVTDNRTGLMWLQEGNYPFNETTSTGTWEQALTYCEGLSYAGYSDWRLPNARELMSIANYQNSSPAIDTAYFLNTQSNSYWTSTTYEPDTTLAWYVNFYNGTVNLNNKILTSYVRAVRSGP